MEQKYDLSQRNALFQGLFENCRIGQIILDEQFRLVFVNRRMYEFFDLPPDDRVDMPFGRIFHCSSLGTSCPECGNGGNSRCGLMKGIKIIREGGMIDNDMIRFSFRRGPKVEIKWFQLNGSNIHYDAQNYILLIFADVTDIKENEAHFKELLCLDLATGTANKYALVESIKRHIRTGGTPRYSLCMIDFDNFKQLNDRCGHLFGDKVLEKFSDIARRRIRKDDVLGRYGGEEFVFIFDDTDGRQSSEILKRIHTELMKYFLSTYGQTVTFSAGIVTIDRKSPVMSYKELLEQADHLLYEAKKLGRSRAVSHTEETVFAGAIKTV